MFRVATTNLKYLPFSQILKDINSNDSKVVLNAVVSIRKKLSVSHNAPIDEVIDCGLVPKLVLLLSGAEGGSDNYVLFEECAWALTNIASSTTVHTRLLLDLGVVPLFISLMSSPDVKTVSQVIWGLGNIAGEGISFRDYTLEAGVLDPLLHVMKWSEEKDLLKNSSWTLSNLFRGKPRPLYKYTEKIFPTVMNYLGNKDDDILSDILWTLSHISDTSDEELNLLLGVGFFELVMGILKNQGHNKKLLTPSLRVVCNFLTGDDANTQTVLNHGILDILGNLLSTEKLEKQICKEVCWALSNITSGTQLQIQQVVDSGHLLKIVELLNDRHTPAAIKSECIWVLSNAITGGSNEHIEYLVEKCNTIEAFIEQLSKMHTDQVNQLIFEALCKIAKLGSQVSSTTTTGTNRFISRFETFPNVILENDFLSKPTMFLDEILLYLDITPEFIQSLEFALNLQNGGASDNDSSDDDDNDEADEEIYEEFSED
eukprot:gene8442-10369_t